MGKITAEIKRLGSSPFVTKNRHAPNDERTGDDSVLWVIKLALPEGLPMFHYINHTSSVIKGEPLRTYTYPIQTPLVALERLLYLCEDTKKSIAN